MSWKLRIPQEVIGQRVKEALARVEKEEGRRYENLTDKDAGLLTSKGGFIAGYNAQAVEVTPSSDDHPQLIPMIEASAQNAGVSEVEDSPWRGVVTLADAGYHSGANLAGCAASGWQVLMPETHDRRRLSPYHKDHFTYQSETDTCLCPQGQTLSLESCFKHENDYQVRRYRA